MGVKMSYGMVKTYSYEDVDENGKVVTKTIKMEFNPLTLIKYHGYVGRDLLADMAEIVRKTGAANISAETEIGELTDSDFDAIAKFSGGFEFLANFAAAMVCTARRNERLDFEDVLASLPMGLITDPQFFTDVTELITFGLKKK